MKILFIALTKHQYRYFNLLRQHLPYECKIRFLPSLRVDTQGFKDVAKIDRDRIYRLKCREVDAKYRNRFKATLYKRFLKMQIPFVIASLSHAIRRFDPDIVAFWNGKKFHQALGAETAKRYGKKCLFFENGLLPDTTQVDFSGVNASNSVPRDAAFYRTLSFDDACRLPTKLQVRKPVRSRRTLAQNALPQRYIFVPFQVSYDTQIIHHSPWIPDMYALFDLVMRVAKETGRHFVLKEHPSDRVSDYRTLHERTNDKVVFSDENTQKLIENAEAVMTINSTVGIEGLLLGKPVIVLGEAFFAIDGIAHIISDADALLKLLASAKLPENDLQLVEKFLKYLYCDYLIPDHWKNPTSRHFQAIEAKIAKHIGGKIS